MSVESWIAAFRQGQELKARRDELSQAKEERDLRIKQLKWLMDKEKIDQAAHERDVAQKEGMAQLAVQAPGPTYQPPDLFKGAGFPAIQPNQPSQELPGSPVNVPGLGMLSNRPQAEVIGDALKKLFMESRAKAQGTAAGTPEEFMNIPQGAAAVSKRTGQPAFTNPKPEPNPPAAPRPITHEAVENGRKFLLTIDPTTLKVTSRQDLGPQESNSATTGRTDKSYTFNAGRLDKIEQPIRDRANRLSALMDSIAQHDPMADSLIAPELLTTMAGGQGSGLRMNEAEISRIIGGRNAWEDIKSRLSRWQSDPSKPFQLLPEQRSQVGRLVQAVASRLEDKKRIIEDASQGLIDTDDPKQHRQIIADAKKKINAIDEAGTSSPAPSSSPKIGDKKTFPNGKVGVWDGNGWAAQ